MTQAIGGLDNGASVGGVNEDDLNLEISFALKTELESRGATVYLTRTDDQDMTKRTYNYSKQDDMYLRRLAIDAYHPDVFLSIHLNSATNNSWGSQVFYYQNSSEGQKLASIIHESMKEVTGTTKNISSCSFYILKNTASLGVLVECGFLSNSNERGQLKSSKYQKKLAIAMSDGIENYFNALASTL
ncbi:MAG: N-acetylmuramoyl-L-alanine amidase [Erysipelotrichaceae bacterium]|nr:N-acetylmuramoyl-L-alanine amidase [Erysipelotrichaceae bacterium]